MSNAKKAQELLAQSLSFLMWRERVTATKLALETGLSRTTISGLRAGKTSPSAKTLDILAKYFGVTVAFLYAERDFTQV